MQVLQSTTEAVFARGATVAIGNFDGVHLGHRALLTRARDLARADDCAAVALTFGPHPARFFAPELAPPLITTEGQKLSLMAETGLDAAVVEPFDAQLAAMPPEDFVRRVLVERLAARHVVVGRGFVFGRGRSGDIETLEALGEALGFVAHGIDPVRAGAIVVSSTKIREFILMGRVRGAATLLGRPFEIVGRVVDGDGRGRKIGIPTANLDADNELVPGRGVYLGWVELQRGDRFHAVINVGTAPTVRKVIRTTIEGHLLDFEENIRGQRIAIGFRQRLRDERRFESVDDLVTAIRLDIANARELLRG